MKLVFLTHLYPKTRIKEYIDNSKAGLASAADAHQYAIALGLNEQPCDLVLVNAPALFYYPLRYKKFHHKGEYIEENGLKIYNLSFSLIMEYTFISQYKSAKKALLQIVRESDEPVYIIVYGIKQQLMHAAVDVKKAFPGKVKLCDIVPDLPEDVNTHGQFVSRIISLIRDRFNKPTNYYFQFFDSFVLLTKQMNEKIKCKENQYIVSEGVYEDKTNHRLEHTEDRQLFTLFYGGMLYEKFGIKNLVNAVHSINNPNIRLQLCGYGDCVPFIKSISAIDHRIHYLGVLPREEVLNRQSCASLLVNPRIPDGNPFTKYSFPSKTMEYFGSGTPALIYQLKGIPEEYYQYCYSLDAKHTDECSLKNKILEIMSIPSVERIAKAAAAQRFVKEKKNYKVVGQQIYNLLARTINNA